MSLLLSGFVTGGFGFLKEWLAGKKEQSLAELTIKQEQARTDNQIKLQVAKGELDNTNERIKMMKSSWMDEVTYFLFYLPLLNMFISPFVDLVMIGEYKQGMLAEAASLALTNLNNSPSWYIVMVVILACLSVGYSKGIEKILNTMNVFKK